MEKLIKAGRIGYGLALAGVGIQQLFYGEFCLMLFPAWPIHSVVYTVVAYIGSLALAGAGMAIVLEKKGRTVALALAASFLILFWFSYVPFEIFMDPYSLHPGVWANALKELALAGGALVIAGTFPKEEEAQSSFLNTLERLIPYGGWFFSATMISFGIDHFLYTEGISKLVPVWAPDPIFWTYFAAVTLIGSGVFIVLELRVRVVANLLGLMILLWLFTLHIPRSIADPFGNRGNEITSAFSALAFSGIAFVIANAKKKQTEGTF